MSKIDLDLSELKKAGVYTIETNPMYNSKAEVFYYAFYFDIRSWNSRLKSLIRKRLYQDPVWLMPDDGENIYKLLVLNVSEFEQLCPQIEKLLKEKEDDNTGKN